MTNIISDIDIKEIIYQALKEKISSAISYQEVHKFIEVVINERQPDITQLMNECFD